MDNDEFTKRLTESIRSTNEAMKIIDQLNKTPRPWPPEGWDWADKIADGMISDEGFANHGDIAEALRQARLDALEEAARVAEDTPPKDGNPWAWPDQIAVAIRCRKDKQP